MDGCEAGFGCRVVETVVGVRMRLAVLGWSGVWKDGRGKDFAMEVVGHDYLLHVARHSERVVAGVFGEQRLAGRRGGHVGHGRLNRPVDSDACEFLDE